MSRIRGKKRSNGPELYEESEWDLIEDHIEKHFGHVENVFHEIVSPDIHVDIEIVEPTPERNYYTLVTCGMGAHRMNVPRELRDRKIDRAELLICLPPEWEINNNDEKWYWPLRWLKIMARLPGDEDSWIAYGHTASNGEPFAENTKLSTVLVSFPNTFGDGSSVCVMPDGSEVNFYQLIPIYDEELDYKSENDAESLEDLLLKDDDITPLNISRRNVCASPPGSK
ncbi:MAG: suppressor of fused domain protein [Candidatus Methanoplasma sp.]|nr:suppressor of fused domain protein [Candidatus Methanoplasma sp.]